MEFVVREARGGTVRYWLRWLLKDFPYLVGVEPEAVDRDAPVVLARSVSGTEHVLLRTGSLRQARRACDRFKHELDEVGETEFRRRYGLRDPSH